MVIEYFETTLEDLLNIVKFKKKDLCHYTILIQIKNYSTTSNKLVIGVLGNCTFHIMQVKVERKSNNRGW